MLQAHRSTNCCGYKNVLRWVFEKSQCLKKIHTAPKYYYSKPLIFSTKILNLSVSAQDWLLQPLLTHPKSLVDLFKRHFTLSKFVFGLIELSTPCHFLSYHLVACWLSYRPSPPNTSSSGKKPTDGPSIPCITAAKLYVSKRGCWETFLTLDLSTLKKSNAGFGKLWQHPKSTSTIKS